MSDEHELRSLLDRAEIALELSKRYREWAEVKWKLYQGFMEEVKRIKKELESKK